MPPRAPIVPKFEFKPGMSVRIREEYANDLPGEKALVGRIGKIVASPYRHEHNGPKYVFVRLFSLTGDGPGGVFHLLPGELDLMEEGIA